MNWIGLNDPWGAKCQSVPNFCAPLYVDTHFTSQHFLFSLCDHRKIKKYYKAEKVHEIVNKSEIGFPHSPF